MALLSRTFLRNCPVVLRSLHTSTPVHDDSFAKAQFKLNGYYKYGLLHDDLLKETFPEVEEAIRRLPEEEQLQRTYRAIRACQAEISHTVLPQEQWSKFEDNHYYLRPYIEEVRKEWAEMEDWEANH